RRRPSVEPSASPFSLTPYTAAGTRWYNAEFPPLTGRRAAPYRAAMYFKQILNEDCGCASYIVASRSSHECAIVDPALEMQPYLDVMADRGMTLRYIIDTHLHADHVSGNRRLSGETGVPVSLHEAADVAFPFEKLRDRQQLELGPVTLEVLH